MSELYVPSLVHPSPARKSIVIDDTLNHTGLAASLVQVLEEATIETITAPGKTNSAGLTAIALPVGFQIAGPVTQIKLTAGTVECHESY